jgi:hypothetical protein
MNIEMRTANALELDRQFPKRVRELVEIPSRSRKSLAKFTFCCPCYRPMRLTNMPLPLVSSVNRPASPHHQGQTVPASASSSMFCPSISWNSKPFSRLLKRLSFLTSPTLPLSQLRSRWNVKGSSSRCRRTWSEPRFRGTGICRGEVPSDGRLSS